MFKKHRLSKKFKARNRKKFTGQEKERKSSKESNKRDDEKILESLENNCKQDKN